MAKIKIAGGPKKGVVGPANPGAIGCIVLIGLALILVAVVLYYSLAK
ncbi:MAG TPA: hypothetical protein VGK29_26305 [Paludibaculum sp.]|jgi:hypothetical protein